MSPLGLRAQRLALLCVLALVTTAVGRGGSEKSSETLYVDIGQRGGPDNVVYGFFEPETGRRVARLQVAHVRLDYGKHGVFRVAWKARPLLTGVELRIEDPAAWPSVVGQLADAFRKMGGSAGVVIRDLVIIRPGEESPLHAAEAELTTTHELVLPRVNLGTGETRRVVLALSGPRAGQFQFSALQVSTSSRSGASP